MQIHCMPIFLKTRFNLNIVYRKILISEATFIESNTERNAKTEEDGRCDQISGVYSPFISSWKP